MTFKMSLHTHLLKKFNSFCQLHFDYQNFKIWSNTNHKELSNQNKKMGQPGRLKFPGRVNLFQYLSLLLPCPQDGTYGSVMNN